MEEGVAEFWAFMEVAQKESKSKKKGFMNFGVLYSSG
jgi:hypothetical protein